MTAKRTEAAKAPSYSYLLFAESFFLSKVGSLDGRFSQYCGYISAQSRASKDATDIVECLEDATKGEFHLKKHVYPEN